MKALAISNQAIQSDAEGRYCLNDLHRAAGGEARHRPGYWLALDQTRALAVEIQKDGIPAISTRQRVGTFVARELVYAYAMWISAAFHLKVIRSFDSLAAGGQSTNLAAVLRNPTVLRQLLVEQLEKRMELESEAAVRAPKAAAFDRLTEHKGAQSLTNAAKVLGIKPHRFFAWLSDLCWIFRARDCAAWQAYQRRIDEGYLIHRLHQVTHADGYERPHVQVLVTPKGLAQLALLDDTNPANPIAANPTY